MADENKGQRSEVGKKKFMLDIIHVNYIRLQSHNV